MKFGYARVSKQEQSLEIQVQQLTHAGCDEIFQEKISGAKDDRPELKHMLDKLRKGDIVCVVRLDRLGRRMMKLIELINHFRNNDIAFVALDNQLDTTNPLGMALFTVCAAFAQMERDLIRERVKAGLDRAHQKGRKGGRPKALTHEKHKHLMSLKESDTFSVREICTMVGITRSVYYRSINRAASDAA